MIKVNGTKIRVFLAAALILLIQARCLRAETASWKELKSEGDKFLKIGRTEAAIGKYKEALALHPESADAWFNLAIACYTQRDAKNAAQALEKLTSLKPEDAEAYYNLGCLYLYDERTEEAKHCFLKAKSAATGSSPFLQLSTRGLEFAESLDDSPSQGLILYLLQLNLATALPLQSTDERLRA